MWERRPPAAELQALLRALERARVPVAAICAATLAVARAGLLDARRHASNAREYLAGAVPGYRGSPLYQEDLAVRDRGVITASGAGSVEFAREIMAGLDVLSEADRAAWFAPFEHGSLPEPT